MPRKLSNRISSAVRTARLTILHIRGKTCLLADRVYHLLYQPPRTLVRLTSAGDIDTI